MAPKLRGRTSERSLQLSYHWSPERNGPHLRYANLDFRKPGVAARLRPLLGWLRGRWPSAWSDRRMVRFLQTHQAEFQRCLDWLSNGPDLDAEERDLWDADRDLLKQKEEWEKELREKWKQKTEVRFLQRHGIDHGGIILEPAGRTGSSFSSVELAARKPRDPLDLICWYLLSLLAWEGTVGVRRCRYAKCGKFFQPRTARRLFCSDLCRAKDHMSKKTLEEKRVYMRFWRKHERNPNVVRAAKKLVTSR